MDLLLLVCLCLLTWSGTTFGERVTATEGSDVILPCFLNESLVPMVIIWEKEENLMKKLVFKYNNRRHSNNGLTGQDEEFEGRVFHFRDKLGDGNASIRIVNTTITDSGNYRCNIPGRKLFRIELVVDLILKDRTAENLPGFEYRRAENLPDLFLKDRTAENLPGAITPPYIETFPPTDKGVKLLCKVQGASPQPDVQWQDSDGNTLTAEEPQVTTDGERYDVIVNVTVTKTDKYRCVVTQKEIGHQIQSVITVHIPGFEYRTAENPDLFLKDRRAEISGAAREPYVTILHQTNDWAKLRCKVPETSPQPHVQWRDSAGNTLTESQGSGEIILDVTVTKTDYYSCVATQDDALSHQTQSGIYVYIHGSVRPVGLIIVVALLVVAVAVLLLLVLRAKGYRFNKENQTPQNNEFKMVNSHET